MARTTATVGPKVAWPASRTASDESCRPVPALGDEPWLEHAEAASAAAAAFHARWERDMDPPGQAPAGLNTGEGAKDSARRLAATARRSNPPWRRGFHSR